MAFADARASKAPLALGAIALGDPPDRRWEGELGVEVHPQQIDGDQAAGQFWLPAYLAQWNGRSLVLPDEDAAAIFQTENAEGKAGSLGRMYDPVGLEAIPLLYGRTYEFAGAAHGCHRRRAGGGRGVRHRSRWRRFTSSGTSCPSRCASGSSPSSPTRSSTRFFAEDVLRVRRPLLGYPTVVFTGKYADPVPLLQAASEAAKGKESFGIPDPDVVKVRIDVEVRALRMDNQLSLSGREAWALLYTTHRDFPIDFDAALEIPLEFLDVNVLDFGVPRDLSPLGVTQAELDGLDALVAADGARHPPHDPGGGRRRSGVLRRRRATSASPSR